MGSHACDRALRFGAVIVLLAALVGCSGRGTNPEDTGTDSSIHDPFDNEEAELLALIMSGELCAPKKLYDQVDGNLQTIRDRWGDSIPYLRSIQYRPFWSPSYLGLGVDSDALADMKAGTYSAWDSLNEFFHLDQVIIPSSPYSDDHYAALSFVPRLDPRGLTDAYAGLPGLRWVQPNVPIGDWSCIYGGRHGTTATYLFRNAWGDCPSGCLTSEFWYFRADGDSIEYVGNWTLSSDTTRPAWWSEARTNWEDYYGEQILWERTDTYVPTAITDLRVTNPGSNEVTLTWTAPADSSYSGRVGSYVIAYANAPITEESWAGTDHVSGPPPSLPGVEEEFRLSGLVSKSDYYFAVKSGGSDGSPSPVSNVVQASTLAAPGWTTFDSTNSAMRASWVAALAADQQGGVWCGTANGVAHFDGSQWQTHDDMNAPPMGETVLSIATAPSGDVWCVGSQGIHVFDGSQWTRFTFGEIGATGSMYCVTSAPDGAIWAGGVHLAVTKFADSQWTVMSPSIENSNYGWYQGIAATASSAVWVASPGYGVARYDGVAWTTYSTSNSGLGSNSAFSVACGSNEVVWLAHDDFHWGLSRFDGTEWVRFSSSNSGLPSNNCRCLMVDSSDRLWIASAGITRFDGAAWTNRKVTSSGLISGKVRAIAEDANGNMWFGTDKGLSRLAAEYVEVYFGNMMGSLQ